MSSRLGPADGRAFTIATSSKLFNNYLMDVNGIPQVDNYAFRRMLQARGPALIQGVQEMQQVGQRPAPSAVNVCYSADRPLLKVPGTY